MAVEAARMRRVQIPRIDKEGFTFVANKRKAGPLEPAPRRIGRPTGLETVARDPS